MPSWEPALMGMSWCLPRGTHLPWPFLAEFLPLGFGKKVLPLNYHLLYFKILGFPVVGAREQITKNIILEMGQGSTCLFMAAIIAMCLRPLWSPDLIEPISTKCFCTENFISVNFLMETHIAWKSLKSISYYVHFSQYLEWKKHCRLNFHPCAMLLLHEAWHDERV